MKPTDNETVVPASHPVTSVARQAAMAKTGTTLFRMIPPNPDSVRCALGRTLAQPPSPGKNPSAPPGISQRTLFALAVLVLGALTAWNIGIAGGGIVGGILLSGPGATSLVWATAALLLAALVIVVAARRHAFPA